MFNNCNKYFNSDICIDISTNAFDNIGFMYQQIKTKNYDYNNIINPDMKIMLQKLKLKNE